MCSPYKNVKISLESVHDGISAWLAARLLNRGKFVWADALRRPSGSGRESRARRKSIGQS